MTRQSKTLVIVGASLILIAIIFANAIPKAAHEDFNRLVKSSGGMSHSPGFPDAYKQMSAQRRMLQNFYIGATGLICLAAGLFHNKITEPVN